MRHLKSYKIFESYKGNIEQELRDICLELEDEGFVFMLDSESDDGIIEFVLVRKDYERFTFSGYVYDIINRIYQFMRELGWYSHLWYSLGGGIKKKFYMRPDGKIRNQDLAWVDENWPSVLTIEMYWCKNYNDKIQEANFSDTVIDTLVWEYGEVMRDMINDVQIVEDMLLDITDLGYYTSVNLTPMTHAGAAKNPQLYVHIRRRPDSREDFYGNFGQTREVVDTGIEEILNYLEGKGYKLKNVYDDKIYKPSEFGFINNPTSYQMTFVKELNKDEVSGESGI